MIKDKGTAHVPLKSARIQNADHFTNVQHKTMSFSSISNNANNVERQVQSKPLEKPVVANVSCLKSEGSKNENSNNFSSSSKPSDYHQVYNKSLNNKDTNKSVGISDAMFSQPSNQGGKIRTKIGGGLEQVRAQRGSTSMKTNADLKSVEHDYQLKDTKSLSMFMTPENVLINKNTPFPNIDISSIPDNSIVKSKSLDTSFFQTPLVSKTSREIIEKNQNILTKKAGAYETHQTSSSQVYTNTGK